MRVFLATIIALLAMLTGCGTTETITSAQGVSVSKDSVLGTDLLAAASNLDQAIAIGVLPANDPAAACVHGVLVQVGLENPTDAPPASFDAVRKGLVSEGSIIYIRVQQLKSLKTVGITPECYALIGKLHIDGLKAAVLPAAILLK